MSSTIFRPVADAIAAKITALNIKAYVWVHKEGKLPNAVIELPDIELPQEDDPDFGPIGQTGLRARFDVTFHFDFGNNPAPVQEQALERVEQFILALVEDDTLGDTVEFARVERAEPGYVVDEPRPLLVYETTVYTQVLV